MTLAAQLGNNRRSRYSDPVRRLTIAALLAAFTVLPRSAAASVQLTIADGRVWLVARDATIAEILDEWARLGGTRIVNADRVPGKFTIELTATPEAQALDLLLRPAGGFAASERAAGSPATRSQSRFATIVIVPRQASPALAKASPPVYQPPAVPVQTVAPGVQRILGPDGQPVPDDQEDAPPQRQVSPAPSMPPGFSAPPQSRPPADAAPGPTPQIPAGAPVPGMIVQPPKGTPAVPPRPPRQ